MLGRRHLSISFEVAFRSLKPASKSLEKKKPPMWMWGGRRRYKILPRLLLLLSSYFNEEDENKSTPSASLSTHIGGVEPSCARWVMACS